MHFISFSNQIIVIIGLKQFSAFYIQTGPVV